MAQKRSTPSKLVDSKTDVEKVEACPKETQEENHSPTIPNVRKSKDKGSRSESR